MIEATTIVKTTMPLIIKGSRLDFLTGCSKTSNGCDGLFNGGDLDEESGSAVGEATVTPILVPISFCRCKDKSLPIVLGRASSWNGNTSVFNSLLTEVGC